MTMIVPLSAHRDIRRGSKTQFLKTLTEEIEAKVTLSPEEDGTIAARAHLVLRTTAKRIPEIREASCTISALNMVNIDVRDLCNKLLKAFYDLRRPPGKARKASTKDFAARVLSVPDIMNPDNFTPYVKRGWKSVNTAKNAVNYYANTIGVQVYGTYGENASKEDFMSFLETEIDRIYEVDYQQPTKDGNIIKKRRAEIYNGIARRWDQARAVQQHLLSKHPEGEWPETLIPVLPRYVTPTSEEVKSIGYERYIKLCTLIKRLCIAEYPLAFCALGEVCNGERVGESSAHLIGDFELRDSFGRCYIDYQLDDQGNRTNILKNKYSHRFVFFGGLMHEMVLLRKSQLEARGYSEAEYELMPFGAYKEEPYTFISKAKVSSFIRRLLIVVGCDEKWLEEEAERMFVAAKVGGTSEDLDTPAHLLRRTIATLLGNGGVPSLTVDAVLGHANEANLKIDYASWDKANEISEMCERAICLGSLCGTKNPAYSPVSLAGNCDFLLTGNAAYQFCADEDTYVDIDITALENGGGFSVIVPETCRTTSFKLHAPIDTIESRRERTIPPLCPDVETIEQWIREAMEIDLSSFIIEEV